MRWAVFLLLVSSAICAVSGARAAQLPDIDINALCSRPDVVFGIKLIPHDAQEAASMDGAVAEMKKGCEKVQRQLKTEIEGSDIDGRLMTYCSADAEYYGKGYLSIAICVGRVRHEAEMARVKDAFAQAPRTYCSTHGSDHACLDREVLAQLRLENQDSPDDATDLARCLPEAVREGDSYEVLASCLNFAGAARNKAATAAAH